MWFHICVRVGDTDSIACGQFLELHSALRDSEVFPPKRILVTAFVPAAWIDDRLIAERKAGLGAYLTSLVQNPQYREHPALLSFLSTDRIASKEINLEDALPSTLSRKAALEAQQSLGATSSKLIAAAYYPDWSADSWPPESLDYSKFDILFFGERSFASRR